MAQISAQLTQDDPELAFLIAEELKRQEKHLELIASENYVSASVLLAQGSILTNKYAEGYPGKRYYGGCQFVDALEELAQARARQLFNAEYVNVQPHSGSQANAAVYMALCAPNDVILGMSLDHGGHLTHGARVSFSGKFYQAVQYGVQAATGLIDYDVVRDMAHQHSPKVIVAGFSAYSRIVDWQIFRTIADEVGAFLFVDMAHVAGLVAAGEYPSPLPYADVVTTTTHKTLRGARGGLILARTRDLEKKLNSAIFPGIQGGPLLHAIAAKAATFKEALQPDFITYQKQVKANARRLSEELQKLGHQIVTGGTDNHMFLLDLRGLCSGLEAQNYLERAQITLNKNMVPGDPLPPTKTSGVRIGTPAITTRGIGEKALPSIAAWIDQVLRQHSDEIIAQVSREVGHLCAQHHVYG